MAAIVDYKVTQIATAATSHPGIMPTHASGDLLVVFQAMDGNQTISTPSGWTSQGNAGISQVSFRVFTKVAASSSETFTGGTSASAAGVLIIAALRGPDATTPVNVTATRSVDDASSPFAGVAATTANDDVLVMSFIVVDGKTAIIHLDTDFTLMASGYAGSAVTGGMSIRWKDTAGSTAAAAWYGEGNANTLAFTIGIKGDGTRQQIHQQANVALGTMVDLCINYGTNNNPSLVNMPASLTLSAIGSKTLARVAPSNQPAAGLTPIWNSAKLSIGATAATDLEGIQADFSVARDYTNRLLIGRYKFEEGALNYLGLPLVGDAAGAGIQFTLRDGSAYNSWMIGAQGTRTTKAEGFNFFCIQPDQTTDTRYASSGTVVNTSLDGYMMTGQGYYQSLAWIYTGIVAVNKLAPCGGTSTNPLTFEDFVSWANLAMCNQILAIQEGSAVTLLCGVQWGGTEPLYIDMSRKTIQFKRSADNANYVDYHVDANRLAHEFEPGGYLNFASATFVSDTSQLFTFDSSFDSSDGTFVGANVIGFDVQLPTGFAPDPMNFINCPNFEQNGSTIPAGTTFTDTTVISDDPGLISGVAFNSSGSTGHGVKITDTGTFDWVANPNTGYGADGTDDAFFFNDSGGAVVINLGPGDAVPTYKDGAGASTTINAYVQTQSIAVNVSALIQIFATGTTTVLASATATSLDYEFVTAADIDIKVQAAGYLEYHSIGVPLADGVLPVALGVDLVEDVSHGLAETTDLTINAGTKRITCVTRQRGVLFYSLIKELYRTSTALRNKPFPLLAVGAESFVFLDGWEHKDAGSLDNWYDAGIDYRDSSFTRTAAWCAVESAGTIPSGTMCEYQQTAGGTTNDMRATGAVQQIIQIYGDASHGNFTRYSHLVIKAQPNGYIEARADIVALSGANLSARKYSFALQPTAIDITTGSSGATVTVTNHGASPVSWQGGTVGVTIQSDDSGEDILRELNYRKSLDATWNGFDPFNLGEAILPAGDNFETQRIIIEGSAGSTYKGVRVITSSGEPHPDFSRFQLDDGTYYTPPTTSSITAPNLTAGWAELYNVTEDTLVESVATTSGYLYIYTEGTDFTAGDTVRIRWAGVEEDFIEMIGVAVSGTLTFLDAPVEDTIYTAYAIDGSTVTEFSLDSGNVQFDIDDPDNVFYVARLYAWYKFAMVSAAGIANFWGKVTAIDASRIRLNQSVGTPVELDNLNAENCRQGDQIVLFTDDGSFPVPAITTGGGGISFYWAGIGYTVETGVSGLTGPESARLFDTLTPSDIADLPTNSELTAALADLPTNAELIDALADTVEAAVTALEETTLPVNLKKVNDVDVVGDGTSGNRFRSSLYVG